MNENFGVLEEEYKQVKQKLVDVKAKYSTREQQFMTKISDLKQTVEKQQENQLALNDYVQQYSQLNELMGQSRNSPTHPIPFFKEFQGIKLNLDKQNQDLIELKNKLKDISIILESTKSELEGEVKFNITLKNQVVEMKSENTLCNNKLAELTGQLESLKQHNENLQKTTKQLIKNTCQYLNSEI